MLFQHVFRAPNRAVSNTGTHTTWGAEVASVIIGLAAQSALGNLVAGVAITIYRPFRLGDTLQVAAPTGTEIGVVEMISLGYTTLHTHDGASWSCRTVLRRAKFVINLSKAFAPWPMFIVIRIGRDADMETARKLVLSVAAEAVGERSVSGCLLTKVEAAVFELRLQAPDAAGRDLLRATLLARLAQRFAELAPGATAGERPSFS